MIGRSGSGKTTLLRLLAGVFAPDRGELDVRGRVGSLLSVDAGLLWHLTGRENARLLCVLSGCSRAQTADSLEDLKARSALDEHFEQPVSTYSQGMRARLGLAAAQLAAPEILLLDEVHEAFDHEHRALLEQSVKTLREGGGIVVASGHDYELLGRLCEHAMLLDEGRIAFTGSFDEVHDAYLNGLGHE